MLARAPKESAWCPKDAVTLAVQFAKLPSGTNHVTTTQVDGVSKQMTVAILNSNYR
jgi:hypothetical protein